MKKAISLFLVFSMLFVSGALFANERKYEFSLAMRKSELPKLDLESFSEERNLNLSFKPILHIYPPKSKKEKLDYSDNSSFWKGALKGALIGGTVGAVVFYTSAKSEDSGNSNFLVPYFSPGFFGLIGAVVGVVIGGLIGGIVEIIS